MGKISTASQLEPNNRGTPIWNQKNNDVFEEAALRSNAIQELVLLPIVFRVLDFVDLKQVYLLMGPDIVFCSCPLSAKEHSQVRSLSWRLSCLVWYIIPISWPETCVGAGKSLETFRGESWLDSFAEESNLLQIGLCTKTLKVYRERTSINVKKKALNLQRNKMITGWELFWFCFSFHICIGQQHILFPAQKNRRFFCLGISNQFSTRNAFSSNLYHQKPVSPAEEQAIKC